MGLLDFRDRLYKPKERTEENKETEKSKPQSHYPARRSSSSSSDEDGETTLNAAQSRERDAATAAASGGTELSNSQSAETHVEIFGPDYDLPRMRGFHLWGR